MSQCRGLQRNEKVDTWETESRRRMHTVQRKHRIWFRFIEDNRFTFLYSQSKVAYGIAITGIVDDDQTTLPVHLSVSESEEPDPWVPKDSIEMDGTVTVKHLTVGKGYTLLRYASFEHVPTKGHVEAFLQSNYDTEHHFTATDTTYMYNDPKKIISTKSVYYRCVPILEQ